MRDDDFETIDADFVAEVDAFLASTEEDAVRVQRIAGALPETFADVLEEERRSKLVSFEPEPGWNWSVIAASAAVAAAFAGMVFLWFLANSEDGDGLVESDPKPGRGGGGFEFVVIFQPDGGTEVVAQARENLPARELVGAPEVDEPELAVTANGTSGNEADPVFVKQPEALAVPEVLDKSWPRTEIDRFVMAALDEHRIVPVADAHRLTLLRRLSFDLTGLPPSPELVERFLHNQSPAAYGSVVDELLATWQFGEHWGRQWLDTAGYRAEIDENIWRYREYVVASLNRDKPFDQFVKEQLVGDLLGGVEAHLAMGFFVANFPEGSSADQVADAMLGGQEFPLAKSDLAALKAIFGKPGLAQTFALELDADMYPPENLVDDDRAATEAKRLRGLISSAERRIARALERRERDRVRKLRADVAELSGQLLALEKRERDRIISSGSEFLAVAGFPDAEGGDRRRAEYVDGLVDGKHPQTARVQVNRVWEELFGRGLVEAGDGASHPELLDFLAVKFVEDGWSVKSLVKRLVTSRCYQLADYAVAENIAEDPGNCLFWRRSPRVLDDAELRDAAIAVAGWLPLAGGAEPRMFARREFKAIPELQSEHEFRSIYATATTVDEELLFEAAMAASRRMGADSRRRGVGRKVRDVFVGVLGRKPSSEEKEWAVGLIRRAGSMSDGGVFGSAGRPERMGERAAYLESLLPHVRVDGELDGGGLVPWAMLYNTLMMTEEFRVVQ